MESKTLSRLIPFRITHYNFEKSSNANLQRIENFIQKFISFGDEVHLIDGDNEVELSFARNYRYTYLLHSTTIMFSHKYNFSANIETKFSVTPLPPSLPNFKNFLTKYFIKEGGIVKIGAPNDNKNTAEITCTNIDSLTSLISLSSFSYQGVKYTMKLKENFFIVCFAAKEFEMIRVNPQSFDCQFKSFDICQIFESSNSILIAERYDNNDNNDNNDGDDVNVIKNLKMINGVVEVIPFNYGIFQCEEYSVEDNEIIEGKEEINKEIKISDYLISLLNNINIKKYYSFGRSKTIFISANDLNSSRQLDDYIQNPPAILEEMSLDDKFLHQFSSMKDQSTLSMGVLFLLDNILKISDATRELTLKYVKFSDLNIETNLMLGSGSYSDVYAGTYQRNDVAVKVIRGSYVKNHPDLFYREILFLSLLAGENQNYVTRYYGFTKMPFTGDYAIILERGISNLRSFYDSTNETSLQLKKQLAVQVILSIKWLHSNGIAHRDIKPDNFIIFYTSNNRIMCKMNDFGTLLFISDSNIETKRGGSLCYGAPELFENYIQDKKYFANESVLKCDIYSLGYVLYEIFYFKHNPLAEMAIQSLMNQYQRINKTAKRSRLAIPILLPSDCLWMNAIYYCWRISPQERPTPDQLIKLLSEPPQRSLLLPPVETSTISVFIDYSNIFNQHSLISINDILKKVSRGRTRQEGFVVGSRSLRKREEEWKEFGFEVVILREDQNNEGTEVDNQLHLIILRNGFTMKMDDVSGDATFVILTGDGNAHNNITSFPGCVQLLLQSDFKVEVWSWRSSCSSIYRQISHPNFSLSYLD